MSQVLDVQRARIGRVCGHSYSGTRRDEFRPESLAGSVNLTQFRQLVRDLLAARAFQAPLREKAVQAIVNARDPERCIAELVALCVQAGGAYGLNAGIDVLALVGHPLLDYFFRFSRAEASRWRAKNATADPNDDGWYILARATARLACVPEELKLAYLLPGMEGTPSVREATIHALGDLGTPEAVPFLREALQDPDAMVRESAAEVLADLEK
jgi:hypothetical protein